MQHWTIAQNPHFTISSDGLKIKAICSSWIQFDWTRLFHSEFYSRSPDSVEQSTGTSLVLQPKVLLPDWKKFSCLCAVGSPPSDPQISTHVCVCVCVLNCPFFTQGGGEDSKDTGKSVGIPYGCVSKQGDPRNCGFPFGSI